MALRYGGMPTNWILERLNHFKKKAIKAIDSSLGKDNNDHLYFDLKILKFDEQLEFQLSSLMWDYDRNVGL